MTTPKISTECILRFLAQLPADPSLPAAASVLRDFQSRAEVARLLPYDPDRAEALLRDTLRTYPAVRAWRFLGESNWHPGAPHDLLDPGMIELGVLHRHTTTEHPRELDGQDYPDADPIGDAPRWLRIATWAVPVALFAGCSTLYFWTF
jgi:hypothetical protein